MKDPIQVKYWETLLGRVLTDSEKDGQCPIKYKEHIIYLELTEINFPYDLMETNVLYGLVGKLGGNK